MNFTSILTTVVVMLAIGLIYSLGMVVMNRTFYRKKAQYPGADCLSVDNGCSSCGVSGCSLNPAQNKSTED